MTTEHEALFWSRHRSREQDVLPKEQEEQQAGQHGLEVIMVKLTDVMDPDQAGTAP